MWDMKILCISAGCSDRKPAYLRVIIERTVSEYQGINNTYEHSNTRPDN